MLCRESTDRRLVVPTMKEVHCPRLSNKEAILRRTLQSRDDLLQQSGEREPGEGPIWPQDRKFNKEAAMLARSVAAQLFRFLCFRLSALPKSRYSAQSACFPPAVDAIHRSRVTAGKSNKEIAAACSSGWHAGQRDNEMLLFVPSLSSRVRDRSAVADDKSYVTDITIDGVYHIVELPVGLGLKEIQRDR